MIKLTNRLLSVSKMIEPCGTLADIGSDHGKLPAYLLQKGAIKYAIVTDISENSLNKAKNLFKRENIANADFLCADGIKGMGKAPDCIVIAGMGGMEIIKILGEAEISAESYIFQPMRDAAKLREYIVNNGLRIIEDIKVRDGRKFYDIIKAYKGADTLSEDEITFGRTNLKNISPDFIEFLQYEKKRIKNLIDNLDKDTPKYVQLYKYEKKLIELISE